MIMHVEKCRQCGQNLKEIKKCQICKKPTQFHCNNCNSKTNEEVHLNCKPSKIIDKITK